MLLRKRCLKTVFLVFTVCYYLISDISNVHAQNEFRFSNEFSVTYNDVSGPGSSSSTLTEGFRFLDVFGLYSGGKIDQYDYLLNIGANATDDPRNDIKKFSLTNVQGRLTNKIHTLTLGDTFEFFSQYALSSAVKGASYRYYDEPRGLPEFTILYGIAYPRWDNVWKDSDTRTIERQVNGGRIKYVMSPDFNAGLSFVRSQDYDRIRSTDQLYDNDVYAFDLEYKPIPGATILGELAFNSMKLSNQEGAPYIDDSGHAYKLTAIGDANPSRVSLEYERITPDFMTLVGSSTPDREKFKAKWRYRHSKTITFNTGLLWYRNNLQGQRRDGRTDTYRPEAGVSLKGLFNRKFSVTDLTYKLNVTDKNSLRAKLDNIISLGYRDRFGVFDSDTNLIFTSYDSSTVPNSRSKEYTYNTSLGSRHTLKTFILKPTINLGGWQSRNELENISDRIYEYSLGLGADIPTYKITSYLKVGQNMLEKDRGDHSQRSFATMNIYYKPKFLEKFYYGMLFLRASMNDFRFTTGERIFRENSITTGLNIQL